MTTLIERLEKTEGPQYALDVEIAKRVGVYSATTRVPAYTSSIDAALTLVPEGRKPSVEPLWSGHGWIVIIRNGPFERPAKQWRSTHTLLPHALCIAALRARETNNDA